MTTIQCECGWQPKRGGTLENHQKSHFHVMMMRRKEVSEEYAKKREESGSKVDSSHRVCKYRCDRGIHKGKWLEDVCKFHPDYIDFLIKNHRHTFPDAFTNALCECGVDPDKYINPSSSAPQQESS
jgi:hypothetical protein